MSVTWKVCLTTEFTSKLLPISAKLPIVPVPVKHSIYWHHLGRASHQRVNHWDSYMLVCLCVAKCDGNYLEEVWRTTKKNLETSQERERRTWKPCKSKENGLWRPWIIRCVLSEIGSNRDRGATVAVTCDHFSRQLSRPCPWVSSYFALALLTKGNSSFVILVAAGALTYHS